MSNRKKILAGILRVEAENKRRLDPNGEFPSCKAILGTTQCERCGYETSPGVCIAARSYERWTVRPG